MKPDGAVGALVTVIAVPHVLAADKAGVGGVDGYISIVTVLLGLQPLGLGPGVFAATPPVQPEVVTYRA